MIAEIEAGATRLSELLDDLLALAREDAAAPAKGEPVALKDLAQGADEVIVEQRRHRPRRARRVRARGREPRPQRPQARPGQGHHHRRRPRRRGVPHASSDEGPGIPPHEARTIFDRFARGSAARGEGSGLGLAIVKAIAERHGGRVEVDGANFTLAVKELSKSAAYNCRKMKRLRTTSSPRLLAIVAVLVAVVAGAGIAQASLNDTAKPAPKPLDRAILDAANAPPVDGVTARIAFTNNLLPSGSLPENTASPTLTGAEGRLWLTNDGRLRLELQSSNGDAQIVADGKRFMLYDAASKTAFTGSLPESKERETPNASPRRSTASVRASPSSASCGRCPARTPTTTADRPSYTVRIAPKDDGGLLGAAELAWDAARGVPLRAAVYAQGTQDPVLELEATEIDYGAIPAAQDRRHAAQGRQGHRAQPADRRRRAGQADPRHRPGRRAEAAATSSSPRPTSWPACRAAACSLVRVGDARGRAAALRRRPRADPRLPAPRRARRQEARVRRASRSRRSTSTAPPARSSPPRSARS